MSKFTKQQFIEMLKAAVEIIAKEHENLSALDAATGDGDHGVTIHRAMQAVNEVLNSKADLPLADLAEEIADAIASSDGGSTSSLLSSYYEGFGNAAPADELDAEQTAAFFEAALEELQDITDAKVGDKTMMDAMIPATETLTAELRSSGDIKLAFKKAAEAAVEGAEKSKEFVAKFGRARTMGEKAIGHKDAGATSVSYVFTAFAETINK